MDHRNPSRPWLGTSLIVASAIAYSTAGFFTRVIRLDAPDMLFWRGLFGGLFMLAVIAVLHGRDSVRTIRAVGKAGLLVALFSALATVCFLNALRLTTVADVLAIEASSPFVSGALAWLIIGERESRLVIAASAVAVVGVIVMVEPGVGGGNWLGAALACGMTLSLSAMFVVMRVKRGISMLPAACLSTFLSSLLVWPFCSGRIPAGSTLLELALFGSAQFGLGLVLLTLGARHVTALRISLLSRLETVLGPLWVLLAFAEVPPATTLAGGALVLGAAVVASLASRPEEVAGESP